jgi:HEAT repeat protein
MAGGMRGILFALIATAALDLASAQDRDLATEFKAAKAGLASQLKDRKKETRLAAVAKLEAYPTTEAAKLLLFQGLGSTDEEVKRASFDVLAKFTSEKDICEFLKTTIGKQWKLGKPQPETYASIALLLASERAEVQEEALTLVREAGTSPTGHHMLITLADELANCRGEAAARPLIELMEVPLFEHDFAFRRAVEQALTHVRAKRAVTALIKLLAKVKGEVRAEIARYLTEVSGQQLGIEASVWQAWWQQNQEKFEFPPEEKPSIGARKARPQPVATGPRYYGLPISAAKIIFVIDTSGSMNGPRIVAAKRELCRAIDELPADVEFTVIAFNSRA